MLLRSQFLHLKSVATMHDKTSLSSLEPADYVQGGCPTALHMHIEVSLYVM